MLRTWFPTSSHRSPSLPRALLGRALAVVFVRCGLVALACGVACEKPRAPHPTDTGSPQSAVESLIAEAVAAERAGRPQQARELRAAAADRAARAGLFADAARQHLALVFAYLYRARDLAAATEHLTAATTLAAGPQQQAQLTYFDGLLARERGDTGRALRILASAVEKARAASMPRDAFAAAQARATLVADVGRLDEALGAYSALEAEAGRQSDCDRAAFYDGYAWLELLAVEAERAPRDPTRLAHAQELLARSLDLYRRRCPNGQVSLATVFCNLAFASLLAGQPTATQRHLDALEALQGEVPLHVELWRLTIVAELAAENGDFSTSVATYERLARLADETLAGEARWRASNGLGRVLAKMGRTAQSIAAFQEAEALLDQDLLGLPIGEGRAEMAALRDDSAAGLAEGLLRQGRARAAMEVLRRARTRVLARLHRESRVASLTPERRRSWDAALSRFLGLRARLEVGARAEWGLAAESLAQARAQQAQLSREALRALQDATDVLAEGPAATEAHGAERARRRTAERGQSWPRGEVVLGYFPTRDGWLGFAETARATVVHHLGRLPALERGAASPSSSRSAWQAELARTVLSPFDAELGAAEVVRVLPYGALDNVDFHALPFRGRPLLAERSVVYGLDVGTPGRGDLPARTQPITRPARGLLVVDPVGNLPGARVEGETVLAAWSAAGVPSVVLAGPAATRARLFDLLPKAELFHYAGHARVAGVEGIASELPLADGGALSLGDIFALGRVPTRVILAGCETARTGSRSRVGLGLAQAFLLAGAHEVVAVLRPVDDDLASEFARRMNEGQAGPWPEAVRTAQLAMRAANPARDWSAFRLLVP